MHKSSQILDPASDIATQKAFSRYRLLYWILITYLAGTLLLYFFGPIPWVVTAPHILMVVGACYIMLALGARPARHRRPRIISFQPGFWKARLCRTNNNRLALALAVAILIIATRNVVLFSTPLPLPTDLLISYDQIKRVEKTAPAFFYINFLLSPILLYLISFLLLAKINNIATHALRIAVVIYYIYSMIMTGSGNAVIEFTLLICLCYLRGTSINALRIAQVGLACLLVAVLLSGLLWFRLARLETMTVPIIPQQDIHFTFDVAGSPPPKFVFFITSMYLTNGYQGLQFIADKTPGAPLLPMVSSLFAQRQYARLGLLPDGFKRLEIQIAEANGWPAGLLWSTSFLWLSEDFPLLLLPILCYLLGCLVFHFGLGYLSRPSAFRLAQTMLVTRIVLFLPLNAIFLATGEELIRTFIYIIFPAIFLFYFMLRENLISDENSNTTIA